MRQLCWGAQTVPAIRIHDNKCHAYPRTNNARCRVLPRGVTSSKGQSAVPSTLGQAKRPGCGQNGIVAYLPLCFFVLQETAFADDVVSYNAGSQSAFLQNVAGVVYAGMMAYLLYKVFTRRAQRFTSKRLASTEEEARQDEEDPELAEPAKVSPFDALIGAAQALGIAAGLYFFATKMDGVLLASPLPDQYTVRNMAVTVRTVLRGLVYLATFIFAANGVGLSALALKLLIFGDEEDATSLTDKSKIPDNIPRVGLTSSLDDVMRALDEASDVSKYQKKQQQDTK